MDDLAADIWTPKLVGDELLDAVRWINRSSGPVGPARMRTAWPEVARMADPDFDGWPPLAEGDARPLRIQLPPRRISQMERVLSWQGRYLLDQPGAGRVLKVWIRSRLTRKMSFDRACQRVGWSRATAYRARDKALATIAIGLTAEGIGFGSH